MSLSRVKQYLKKYQLENQIIELEESSATVLEAAKALHTHEENIAKSLSFFIHDEPVIIVCAGNISIDDSKFKDYFHTKASMIKRENVEELIGHAPGGVCPFAIKKNVKVYLDESLKPLNEVYPACGSSNSAIKLTLEQLEKIIENFQGWVDVGKKKE